MPPTPVSLPRQQYGWLASRQRRETINEASRLIGEISDPENLSKGLKSMYYSTLADITLRQKRFGDAVAPLTKAMELTGDKDTKVRLDLPPGTGMRSRRRQPLSTRYFRQVIRMNPSYDLEFNAGINLAGVTDISHGDAGDLMKSLRRMLRDSKNKDYLDQIYFAMGELDKRTGNTDEAIRLWSQSAATSTVNSRQKARAYLALGEHYYARPDYLTAAYYYDSAFYLLDDQFPDYETIGRRTTDLFEYAGFRTVVITEDSLRRVAGMSAAERDAFIAAIIRSVEAEQAKARTGEGEDRYNMGLYYENEQRYQGSISAEGGWYFYNQTALSFGRSEFKRRWGDRRLEDNWRRANKARLAFW
ncbi:MAG: hypothetical protein MZV63_48130 [Marinilabiliales bacterium]|nr:hypothetical protein [Marinilabiliales bacterium]